jgi:hypothetical protein
MTPRERLLLLDAMHAWHLAGSREAIRRVGSSGPARQPADSVVEIERGEGAGPRRRTPRAPWQPRAGGWGYRQGRRATSQRLGLVFC